MSSFVARNKQDWDELERLVQRGRRSLRSLSAQELSRLDVLYRRTTIHLARAATRTTDRQLINYLNGLTASAHSLIYLPPRRSLLVGSVRFGVEGFARCIARNLRFHALALVVFLAGGVLAYYLAVTDTMAAYALSMPGDERQPGSTQEQLEEFLRYGRDQGGGEKFLFATFLAQHNVKVGLLSMVSGVLGGVPTILLLVYNGMVIGAFIALHHQAGITWEVWAWLLPHGITEIGAIILCGGVGLMLGRSILRPGELSRADSLRLAGREAALTAVGIFAMLLAAAVIESYLRQSHLSMTGRFLFAGGSALFWTIYILFGVVRERADNAAAGPG